MSHSNVLSSLAYVVPGMGGGNYVRQRPEIPAQNPEKDPKFPERAVIYLYSDKPADWPMRYPYENQGRIWYKARGRARLSNGTIAMVEGWTAVFEGEKQFIKVIPLRQVCPNYEGSALDSDPSEGQKAYVVPGDGLNLRRQAAVRSGNVIALMPSGTVVTVISGPRCITQTIEGRTMKMIWWRLKWSRENGSLEGWACEVLNQDHYLAPTGWELS